jgi:hypothetical protein
MSGSAGRAAIVILLCAVALSIALRPHSAGFAATGDGEITPEIRAATLDLHRVQPDDQAWIRAAIATARPEAQRLIAEVDGLVTIDTTLHGSGTTASGAPDQAIGLVRFAGGHAEISLDTRALNGDRAFDRNVVVLHELGHVIDYVLVDDELMHQLDAGIPPAGPCQSLSQDFGPCTAIEERFADTFAKWALRGRFSLAGSGYGVPTPPSLEDWGAPLGRLALQLDARAGE